jgi:LuxR family maltose regulon positive regulatory protein
VNGTGEEDALPSSPPRPVHGPRPYGSPPRLGSFLIDRPRLLRRLDERPPLTLLRAPTGFGKTTLVAQWAAGQDPAHTTVVWLRVRSGGDGDAATVFWSDTLRALAAAGLDSGTDQSQYVGGPAARVELMLQAARQPVVLVVDGLDQILAPEPDGRLLDLLHHTPWLQLVVCLRGHRHFPTLRHLDLEADMLTAGDLRFTEDETADLLSSAGVDLSPDRARALHEETSGWPEPTQAVALRLRCQPDLNRTGLAEVVDEIAAEYLRERLLSETVPADRAEFVLATALPEDFSAELAEVLGEDRSAKSHLEALAATGVLTTKVRRGAVVYRWPPAARRALRSELHRRRPEQVPELHRRLARWYREQDDPASAVRHSVAAEDWNLFVDLIDTSWRQLFLLHYDDLHRIFISVPEHVIERSTRALALREARLSVGDDRLLERAVLPESAAELRALGRRPEAADTIDIGFAVVVALRSRGYYGPAATYGDRLLQIAEAALAARPEVVASFQPSVHLHVGLTYLLSGDLSAAVGTLRRAYDRRAMGPSYVEIDAAGKLALTHALAGETVESEAWLSRHSSPVPVPAVALGPLIDSTAQGARLLVALHRLDLAAARRADAALAEHIDRDEFWAFLSHARAQLALHVGAESHALSMLDQVRRVVPERHGPDSLARPMLAAAEADLLLALGRGNQARAVLMGPDVAHPWLRVGRARLSLLAGDARAAAGLAGDNGWARTATARQRTEMLLIAAVAAHRLGDHPAAVDSLRRAVDGAQATGALRPFTTVPRVELAELAPYADGAEALLATPSLAGHPDIFPADVTVVQLSEREQHVLAGLAEGLTVREIADAAVLSFNTVRTQKRSLYKKLGTSDRAEAIARAREWGLLPGGRAVS